METKRLFLSLPIPAQVNKILEKYIRAYRHLHAKWVEEENRHITLLFIGDVPSEKISELEALCENAVGSIPSFELSFESVCFFPSATHPHMIWARFHHSPQFVLLSATMAQIHQKTEQKETIAHVTLARLKEHHRQHIEFPELHLPLIMIDHFDLVESQLTKKGPIYTLIKSYPLCTNTAS